MLTSHRHSHSSESTKKRDRVICKMRSGKERKVHIINNLRNKTKAGIPEFPSRRNDRVDDGEKQDLIHFWRTVHQSMAMSKCTGQQ